ncbi:DUF6377 domain-containing protein [uncultured Alistipes sp.]|jgi:putative regulatory protein|uniref:DUF6377 domain-containing protein n=1 Tax=uncultured Alistipes sp. TaxID=538949 RepID=UPI0025D3A042|nr:DUF6377 domain-containing protein [uncultured Alistipes sp.]
MKPLFHITGLFCLIMFVSCHKSETERVLDKLDRIIEHKHIYEKQFEHRADSLRSALRIAGNDSQRWQTAHRLFEAYITYNIDTAARYVVQMFDYADKTGNREMKFISATSEVSLLITRSNIEDAYERIISLDTVGITKRMRANYYSQKQAVYHRLSTQDPSDTRRRAYADTLYRLRHIRIGFDGHSHVTRQRYLSVELLEKGETEEALDILMQLYDPDKYNERTLAMIAYNIASLYDITGDSERQKYWLATTAIHDLQTPVKEYVSLYKLALLMFEDKDMDRAASYIQCTMADMLACNYNSRILQSSKAEMIINQAMVYSINSRSRILTVMVNVFLGLFIIIVFLLIHTLKQHHKQRRTNELLFKLNSQLHERNEQFRQVNHRLRDANKIKDSYVFRYMYLATSYIGRVDEYRLALRQTAKTDGPEALMRKLRSPSDVDRDYRDFYRIFDETFLGIFPDFVERVNELLEEQARFPVPVGGDRVLPTELRILAVMRLGITDSGRIASFLNCAAATVYTYRTKLRNSALGSRSEFETKIQHIGL